MSPPLYLLISARGQVVWLWDCFCSAGEEQALDLLMRNAAERLARLKWTAACQVLHGLIMCIREGRHQNLQHVRAWVHQLPSPEHLSQNSLSQDNRASEDRSEEEWAKQGAYQRLHGPGSRFSDYLTRALSPTVPHGGDTRFPTSHSLAIPDLGQGHRPTKC